VRPDRITLAFFIDALGWRLAEELDCFTGIAPHRYRQRTVLGYSCAAQPTILTGLSPAEHGHWAMFYRTERSELAPLALLRFIPPVVADHRRFRRRVLLYHQKRSGFTGYYNFYRIPFRLFREFDLVEKRDIYSPGAFEGCAMSIFDILAREEIPYRVWNWKHDLDRSLGELEQSFVDDRRPRFALVYTAAVDALLHEHVGERQIVTEAIRALETKIARVVAAARRAYRHVDVLVFSDHGMTETTGARDLMSVVGNLGLVHGRDYLAFYDSTMARFWFSNPGARETVSEELQRLDCGTILTDEALRAEEVFFADGRYGELVFLMNPGVLIVPSYMSARAPRGMHGFTPDHPDSDAVLMSSAPVSPEPARIADTFNIMKRLAVGDA